MSDTDNFSFDANLAIPTGYTINVGKKSQVATMTNNKNGSLKTLAISDGFYANENQTCQYLYDSDFRLGSSNCGTEWQADYSYDQYGNIDKSAGAGPGWTQYLYGPSSPGAIVGVAQTLGLRIPLPGGAQAITNSTAVTDYRRPNWQGSQPIDSSTTQTVLSDAAYSPFGEHYQVNGYSGYYAGNLSIWSSFMDGYAATFRLYHYDQGRWVSPDPAGLSAVDPTNPQSWNRYAYALNNPLSGVDPSGLIEYCPWGTIPGQNVCAGPPTNSNWFDLCGTLQALFPGLALQPCQMAAQGSAASSGPMSGSGANSKPLGFCPAGNNWVYAQSTGNLQFVNSQGTASNAGAGYSGNGDGQNNPAMQGVANVGPIPQGNWNIGPQQNNDIHNGRVTLTSSMRLAPGPGTDTFGRTGFLIHGDNARRNGSASEGCIVLGPSIRNQIVASGVNALTVTP